MPYQNIEPISKQLTIVIGLTVVGFMAFGLTLSFYRNILFDQRLTNFRDENTMVRGRIDVRYRDLEYFRSTQYKDKYAKENLGLVQPGEKVLIITEVKGSPLPEALEEVPTEQQEAAYEELLRQMPVAEHWRIFLFHRERIDELKTGL